MDWLKHPSFVQIRDSILTSLQRDEYKFRRVGDVVFLCGGANSRPRDWLARYLREKRRHTLVFYAESVWSVIAEYEPTTNALAMEERLAQLADIVIVLVESPGTFAELGAFAISELLRAKLLPVLQETYQTGASFIETGPVRWVDYDSLFRPTLWTRLDAILQIAPEIEERLSRIPSGRVAQVGNLAQNPKHLVFFVADLVSVFGPCPH